MRKNVLSILFALVLISISGLVPVLPTAAGGTGNTLIVTGPGDIEIFSLAEMDQHFSSTTIDSSESTTILSGEVTLGNFEAGNGADVWYEIGLVSNKTYLGYSRLHNKGVYMIALWDATGSYYKVHMQNVPGYENPSEIGSYLGDDASYTDLWNDADLCYFKVPQAGFQYEIKYRNITASGGRCDLRISIDNGITWSGWKYWKYTESDEYIQYSGTYSEAEMAAIGYADDDDLTDARIVSQLFTNTSSTATFTATYDNVRVNGGTAYTLGPRVLNTNTGRGYAGIQAAIDDATAGETIQLAAGTYEEDNIDISKALTLRGANYRDATDGYISLTTIKTASPDMEVILSIHDCQDVSISWLTLDLGGRAGTAAAFWGGADFNYSSLSDCRIQGEAGDTYGTNLLCVLQAYNGAEKVKFERNIVDAEILDDGYAAGIGLIFAVDITIKDNVINGHGTAGNGVLGMIYGPAYIEGNIITGCENGV